MVGVQWWGEGPGGGILVGWGWCSGGPGGGCKVGRCVVGCKLGAEVEWSSGVGCVGKVWGFGVQG